MMLLLSVVMVVKRLCVERAGFLIFGGTVAGMSYLRHFVRNASRILISILGGLLISALCLPLDSAIT